MPRHHNRPNPMLAAPIVTLPTAITRHVVNDLLDRGDPAWHLLADRVRAQLFPGSPEHTLTLPPTDLLDLLSVLLDISIDYGSGELNPSECGFTEAEIHETIDVHQHHYGPLTDY